MKKQVKKILFLLLITSTAACGVYSDINTYADSTIDFNKYRTFAWLPDSGMTARADSFRNTAYDNDIIRNNAKNYITHNLNERGLRVQVDNPDLLAQLVLHNEKKERRVATYAPSYPYSPYYYHQNPFYYPYYYPYYDYYTYYGWGCQNVYCDPFPPDVREETYVKGTITINMYDRKLKKLVWSGSAEGDIYDPSYIQEAVHPAVNRILKDFPIKKVSSDQQQPLTRK